MYDNLFNPHINVGHGSALVNVVHIWILQIIW
jgi:hypothetical protein